MWQINFYYYYWEECKHASLNQGNFEVWAILCYYTVIQPSCTQNKGTNLSVNWYSMKLNPNRTRDNHMSLLNQAAFDINTYFIPATDQSLEKKFRKRTDHVISFTSLASFSLTFWVSERNWVLKLRCLLSVSLSLEDVKDSMIALEWLAL